MAVFLTVHARYKDVQFGIFRDEKLLLEATDESKKISKRFIEILDTMLKKQSLSFSDLSFVAAHQGPAPFTTLRVCLATVNGLSFATGMPLIGINGLEALIDEYTHLPYYSVALLNAFSNDVYYALWNPDKQTLLCGCAQAPTFLQELQASVATPINFIGNGSIFYKSLIEQIFNSQAVFKDIELASLDNIAKKALVKWKSQETSTQLMPLYLKNYTVVI